MTRRLVVVLSAMAVVASALPLILSVALVREPGGSGVVTGTIWVANEAGDSVAAIDADTHAVVTVVRGIRAPHNVQASPDGATIWVTSPSSGLVAVIDARTLALRGAVRTGAGPAHVVVTADGETALVTNAGEDSLAIVDVASLEVMRRVRTGAYPHGLRPSPDGHSVLLANLRDSTVTLIDVDAGVVRGEVIVGRSPVQVAFSPAGDVAYATVSAPSQVVKIDLQQLEVVGRARVGHGPVQLATTPDGSLLVVASQGDAKRPNDTVALVDTETMRVVQTLSTGLGAHGVSVDSSGRQAFVTDVWAGDVAVIDLDLRHVVDRIRVGGEPNGVTYSTLVQPHARGASNMNSPVVVSLPLGGATDGRGSGGHNH